MHRLCIPPPPRSVHLIDRLCFEPPPIVRGLCSPRAVDCAPSECFPTSLTVTIPGPRLYRDNPRGRTSNSGSETTLVCVFITVYRLGTF
jgi:hypothetical protein